MPAIFPNQEWQQAFQQKLNTDEKYAHIARNWEGDMTIQIEPSGPLIEPVSIYLDLWHGKCRAIVELSAPEERQAAYILSASYEDLAKVLTGELYIMQALLTRKLKLDGDMAYVMRNVPVVLDFVRCAQETTQATGKLE